MERFVVISDISKETMDGIRNDFMKEFNIDLDKVSGKSLNEKWERVLDKCFGEEKIRSIEDMICYIDSLTAKALYRPMMLSDNNEGTNAIITSNKITESELQNIKRTIGKLAPQIYNGYILDDDVWLNAYFTITFIKPHNDDSFYQYDAENGELYISEYKRYKFPIEHYPDSGCCSAFLKTFLSPAGSIFGSATSPELVIEFDEHEKAKLVMIRDKDFTRWSWNKILEVEKREDFKIDDRVLFAQL